MSSSSSEHIHLPHLCFCEFWADLALACLLHSYRYIEYEFC